MVVGWPTLKLRGAYFAIATWALAEAILQLANVAAFTNGSSGLTIPAFASSTYFYYAMLTAALASFAITYVLLERSRFGYQVKAVRTTRRRHAAWGSTRRGSRSRRSR